MKTTGMLLGAVVLVLAVSGLAHGEPPFTIPPGALTRLVTPPLAGLDFLCQVVNLTKNPLFVSATIFDDGGTDISSPPSAPFISCEGAPIGPGVVCTTRVTPREDVTSAYCRIGFFAAGLNSVRASLQVFDLNGGGIAAAVEAH
jgi:hypothetical protein